MAEIQSPPRLVRFGAFEADLQTGELRKNGVKLKFSGQPFQVLAILLEHPGKVVTREELQKRLWPDTFVDVERNLNTAINKIRDVLGDSAESPTFVETLPRKGYRFIAALESSSDPDVPAGRGPRFRTNKARLITAIGLLALAGIIVAVVFAYLRHARESSPENRALDVIPFTSLNGEEISPAFSPDGSRIAFGWNGDPGPQGRGFDLYVKAIGSETLLRLTKRPSDWITAAWSPDGTQITFQRLSGAETGVYIVPALGGPERKLHSTQVPSTVSWSSDGKWIVFADVSPDKDHQRIFLFSTDSAKTQELERAPGCVSETFPAFSHRGDWLAYSCTRNTTQFALYVLSIPDGKPKMIATFTDLPASLVWSADDKKILYNRNQTFPHELGEVDLTNGSTKRLHLPWSATSPSISPKGGQLAFSVRTLNLKIWRKDLRHQEYSAVEVAPSTREQSSAAFSPDGRRIAFQSSRTGVFGVWVSDIDGSSAIEISDPHSWSGSPQWSPDGAKIAFDSKPLDHWEIYVADAAERIARKLITDRTEIFQPHWSHDGKWIYFRSGDPGRKGLFRCPSSGGASELLSSDVSSTSAQESPDGTSVYFAEGEGAGPHVMKKIDLAHGRLGTVANVEGFPELRWLWAISSKGIYFVPFATPDSVEFYDFSTKRVHPLFKVDKDFEAGFSVSPDDRWIIYSQIEGSNSDIMLVNDFN